jgi:hypothetical protein
LEADDFLGINQRLERRRERKSATYGMIGLCPGDDGLLSESVTPGMNRVSHGRK